MGGDISLGDDGGVVPTAEAGGLVRFIILEELGRETWTEFLRCRKVLPAAVVPVEVATVMNLVEADSGCFSFDFDEIEVKFRDVGGPFG
jgi:hypothetical protein